MTKKIRITSNMIGCEIDFIVLKLDAATHSVVASRKKAMEKKVQNFYRPQVEDEAPLIQEGSVVEARILGGYRTSAPFGVLWPGVFFKSV